jgi:uncharacterized membrane protein YfcA
MPTRPWFFAPAMAGIPQNRLAGAALIARLARFGLLCLPLAAALAAGTTSPSGGALGPMTSIAAAMPDAAATLLGILFAMFAGALVSGLAGFAFSAVAGTLLLRLIEPAEAVSLLLVCSLAAQLQCLANLRDTIEWRRILPLVAAGLAGIPIGALILQILPAPLFAAVFGIFLVGYSAVLLVRPMTSIRRDGRIAALVIGFAGGLTGGAIAFPGALPTIWCTMQGLSKERQRGLIQPFIVVMQIATIAYFSGIGIMTAETLLVSLVCAPAILIGTWLGLRLYRRFDDGEFRRLVLVMLLVCGAMLVA